MEASAENAKGRIKQAIGALSGDEELQRDGRRDEHEARVKRKADGAIEAVRDKLEGVAEMLHPSGRKSE